MNSRLHRFRTYPNDKINEQVTRDRSFETSGGSYTLSIKDQQGNFTLKFPTGETVSDSFNDMGNRADLYMMIEVGEVYKWMLEVMESTQTELVRETGFKTYKITMKNTERYEFLYNSTTGMCRLEYPERNREFYLENIFIENPELPLMYEGRYIEYLTDMLKKDGVTVPEVPYYPGFKVTEK